MLRCWSRCPPPLMLLPRLGRRCWHRRPPVLVPRLTRPPREALQPRPAVLQHTQSLPLPLPLPLLLPQLPLRVPQLPLVPLPVTNVPARRLPLRRVVPLVALPTLRGAKLPLRLRRAPLLGVVPLHLLIARPRLRISPELRPGKQNILLIARSPTSLWPLFVFCLSSVGLLAATSLPFLGHNLKSRHPTSPLHHPSLILSSTFWHPVDPLHAV